MERVFCYIRKDGEMRDEIFINIHQLPVQMRTTSSSCRCVVLRDVLVLISTSLSSIFEEQYHSGDKSLSTHFRKVSGCAYSLCH